MKKLGWMLLFAVVLTLALRPAGAKAAGAEWVYNEDYQTWMYVDEVSAEQPEHSDIYVDHWVKYQGQWYHFLTGWQYDSGKWYYLFTPNSGGMAHDRGLYLDGETYWFSKGGAMYHDCWIKEVETNGDGSTTVVWHYAKSSGKLAKGWLELKGTWYYFADEVDPYMVSGGICTVRGKDYYFNENGAMQSDRWIQIRRYLTDEYWVTDWYYAGSSGALYTGWHEISGKWYYFDQMDSGRMYSGGIYGIDSDAYSFAPSGARQTGWVKYEIEGLYDTYTLWAYADPASGKLLTGFQEIGGKIYYFDDQSYLALAAGGYSFRDVGVYVFADSGALITKKGWSKAGGDWYYIQDDYTAATDWKTIGGKRYYFLPRDGSMATGLVVTGMVLDRFADNGVYKERILGKNGWFRDGDDWYYFDDGDVCVGWQDIRGKRYYFDPQYGYMYTGPATIRDEGYYFNSDGALTTTTGWKKLTFEDGEVLWFYTRGDGSCMKGWETIGDKTYYFDPDYYFMYAGGTYLIDGHICVFDDSGARIQ